METILYLVPVILWSSSFFQLKFGCHRIPENTNEIKEFYFLTEMYIYIIRMRGINRRILNLDSFTSKNKQKPSHLFQ